MRYAASTLSRNRSMQRREALYGLLFICPAVLGMLIFNLGPILAALFFSFTKYSIITKPKWTGLANYQKAFTEELVAQSFGITAYYVLVSVPLGIGLAFAVALLLNRIKGAYIYRTAFYVPSVVPTVASAVIWLVILNPSVGLVNYFISLFGVKGPGWLIDPDWATPGLILMSLWSIGTGMVLYLAGLQGVPEHLYEAAEIDGATEWQKILMIKLPLMMPVLIVTLLLRLIDAFKVLEVILVLTNGGPGLATEIVALRIFRTAQEFQELGEAAAMSNLLLMILMGLTIGMFAYSKIHEVRTAKMRAAAEREEDE